LEITNTNNDVKSNKTEIKTNNTSEPETKEGCSKQAFEEVMSKLQDSKSDKK
jgi:hypothetical protein